MPTTKCICPLCGERELKVKVFRPKDIGEEGIGGSNHAKNLVSTQTSVSRIENLLDHSLDCSGIPEGIRDKRAYLADELNRRNFWKNLSQLKNQAV